MMGLCKDCKHWQPNEDGKQGSCLIIDDICGCCWGDNALPEGELAQIQSSYDVTHSNLVTAPEFGCVLFEQKEPPHE